jgi:hypothetical protein
MAGDGKILVTLPGSGVVVEYADQRERGQSVRLAQARQWIAQRTGYIPAWDELGEGDRETAALEARNWLRAMARLAPAGDGIIVSREDVRFVVLASTRVLPAAVLGRLREALGEAGDGN